MLEPLEEKPRAKKVSFSLVDDGDLDEEAEQAAFTNAVMEWRRAGQTNAENAKAESAKETKGAEAAGFTEKIIYVRSKAESPHSMQFLDSKIAQSSAVSLDDAKEHAVRRCV
jgi:hypothetical protein